MSDWPEHIRDAEGHLESAESSAGIGDYADTTPSAEDASAAALMSIASSLVAIAKMLDYHGQP